LFYVLAGALLLAAGVAVDARLGAAQSQGQVYFAGDGGAAASVSGHTVYYVSNAAPHATPFPQPVPGAEAIVSVHVYNAGFDPPATTVVLADGSVYNWNGVPQGWALMGTLGSGAVPVRAMSWGKLKALAR
jgi:hypothetical protein